MKDFRFLPIIVITSVLVILVVITAIWIKKTVIFDERQKLARNAAYKAAFCTLAVYCFCCGLLSAFGIVWADTTVQMLIGVAVSGTVFTVICMVKDAYLGLNDKRRWWKFALGAFSFAFYGIARVDINHGQDDVLFYLVVSACCCVIGIVATVKEVRASRSRKRKKC